jgi:hypothetical protein
MEIMQNLHLNYMWIVSVLGVGLMVAGLVYLFMRLFPQIASGHSILEKTNKELQVALENIKTLKGLIPICASCKKIRGDNGYWNQIEVYIRDHSEAEFTHGLCSECAKKMLEDDKKGK